MLFTLLNSLQASLKFTNLLSPTYTTSHLPYTVCLVPCECTTRSVKALGPVSCVRKRVRKRWHSHVKKIVTCKMDRRGRYSSGVTGPRLTDRTNTDESEGASNIAAHAATDSCWGSLSSDRPQSFGWGYTSIDTRWLILSAGSGALNKVVVGQWVELLASVFFLFFPPQTDSFGCNPLLQGQLSYLHRLMSSTHI